MMPSVTLRSRAGERSLLVEDLFVDYLTTRLQPGDVLTAIHLPPLSPGVRYASQDGRPRPPNPAGCCRSC